MTSTKPYARKATIVEDVTPKSVTIKVTITEDVTPKPVTVDPQFSYVEFLRNTAAASGIAVPTGKQMLAGAIVSFLTGFVGGYATTTIAAYIFVGAILFTGSVFLAYLSMFITLAVGVYIVLTAASRAGAYVANGELEKDVIRAKSWITGLWTRGTSRLQGATS